MIETKIKVTHKVGLHARPADRLHVGAEVEVHAEVGVGQHGCGQSGAVGIRRGLAGLAHTPQS